MPQPGDIPQELFAPAAKEERAAGAARGQAALRQGAWGRHNRLALASAVFIIVIALLAIIGPYFAPYRYDQMVQGSENLRPFTTWGHLLGTDGLGRDELVRLMYGARISLAIGVAASFIVVVIGVVYGAVAGYFGGLVDSLMMRVVDIVYAVPALLVMILLSVVLKDNLERMFASRALLAFDVIGPGIFCIFVTFALLYWVDMARLVRGQILSLKRMDYVVAAKALGARPLRIMARHLIPNCMGVIVVTATLNVPLAIFNEAFLSFIGLGVSAPMASLGSLASDALGGIYTYPYLLICPSVLISLIILAFNLLGDGLRDALDPRLKNG